MKDLEIHPDDVRRILGMPQDAVAKPALNKALEEAIAKCSELIDPKMAFRKIAVTQIEQDVIHLEGGTRLEGGKLVQGLQHSKYVVVFVVTVGPLLEEKIAALTDAKKPFEAFVYDAVGSVAAEGLAESFQQEQDELLLEEGCTTTLRFSPGYCNWPIEAQRMIFNLLKADAAGVSLTQSCIMLPRKSVSGVLGIIEHLDSAQQVKAKYNPCKRCDMKNCNSRRK